MAYLPDEYQQGLNESYRQAGATFELVENVRTAASAFVEYTPGYRPLHIEVRQIQKNIRRIDREIEELDDQRQRITFSENVDEARIEKIQADIAALENQRNTLESGISANWTEARAGFEKVAKAEKTARLKYRQNVDDSYGVIATMRKMISETEDLQSLQERFEPLLEMIQQQPAEDGLAAVKDLANEIDMLTETDRVTSRLSKAKRALRGNTPDKEKAIAEVLLASQIMQTEIEWRERASEQLSSDLEEYDSAISRTIGMRMQERLTSDQAESIAGCLAVHKDLSLHF
jgi:chromosome segregation ATPase